MAPRLITMLTHHDQTVKDALAYFEQCRDLPVQCWGFKDIGLPAPEMKRLVQAMQAAGKTVFLEIVSYPEEECLRGARLAVECDFDYLMGTVFYPSVFRLLRESKLKYLPFCGKVSGNPSVLEGSMEEIIAEARKLQDLGVDGFDLLAFRHRQNPVNLAREFVRQIGLPVIIAGSIDSNARLDLMKELNPWGFTVGSAFFEKKFASGGSFRQQIETVAAYLA